MGAHLWAPPSAPLCGPSYISCGHSLSSGQSPHPHTLITPMPCALTVSPCADPCLTMGWPFTTYLLSTNPSQLQSLTPRVSLLHVQCTACTILLLNIDQMKLFLNKEYNCICVFKAKVLLCRITLLTFSHTKKKKYSTPQEKGNIGAQRIYTYY